MTTIAGLIALFLSTATASPAPEIRLLRDGSVEGRLVLDADADRVLAALEDPTVVGRWSPSVTAVEATPRGACEQVEVTMRGWIFPMRVTSERCPTPTGFRQAMVDSNVFTRWGAEWSVRETDDGTEVRYVLYSELALPVTTGFVQGKTAASMRAELAALWEAVRLRG